MSEFHVGPHPSMGAGATDDRHVLFGLAAEALRPMPRLKGTLPILRVVALRLGLLVAIAAVPVVLGAFYLLAKESPSGAAAIATSMAAAGGLYGALTLARTARADRDIRKLRYLIGSTGGDTGREEAWAYMAYTMLRASVLREGGTGYSVVKIESVDPAYVERQPKSQGTRRSVVVSVDQELVLVEFDVLGQGSARFSSTGVGGRP